jgi:ABC-type transporter Mla subunit MlaD
VRADLNSGQEYHQTLCVLSINKKYTDIPSNVEVKLMTRGLGSSYLELKVDPRRLPAPPRYEGDPTSRYLREGMPLQGSTGITSEFFPEESQQKLDTLVAGIGQFISNANHIIGDPNNQKNFKAALANVTKTSETFPQAVDEAVTLMKDMEKTMAEFRRLASTGTDMVKNADGRIEQLAASMVATSDEIGKSAAQLRLTVEKINSGQGSAGRLLNDGHLYEGLLDDTTQLGIVLKDLKELLGKINEKGLRSVY